MKKMINEKIYMLKNLLVSCYKEKSKHLFVLCDG